ncbi:tRNA (adenosine(37)-N6)-threonylcarbamoyltransferase complex dimerization subunit type 1 TsaB [Parafrigoribacterium mesophilum]|uniref:tRNA (adenosine(37)-N6)-threonylcarbamoyltransferase complex dimerization subunit type 1 TsaB n=1 Tax=Parafrigoribacterium mesophilum TaxID=433646 RepID=UPI0031FC78FF
MLLAIDTSAGTSVAVVDPDRGTLALRHESGTRSHAEVIGTLIAESLTQSQVTAATLSAVAVGMGPGPFTGLRVGIAAAQAFALGAGKSLLRVVSHDAVAFGRYAEGFTGPLLVVTDARRREVYWSAYSGVDATGIPQRVDDPGLSRPGDLAEAVTDYPRYERLDATEVSAASVGLLAEALHRHGRAFAGPAPLYLRSPDVTVPTSMKRVSQ